MTTRSLRIRLFISLWMIYVLHFATDFAREHFLVVSMVEDHTFALDKYYGLHADIFMNPPEATVKGAHHGANPGISMVAAIPYLVLKPAVDFIVNRNLAARGPADTTTIYNDTRPNRVRFYQETRKRGLDVRFGLVAAITMVFFMAPLSALSALAMLALLDGLGLARRVSLGLTLLYALGTPVFFRTGYLNQNLGLGIFAFFAFLLLWDPGDRSTLSVPRRFFLAGFLGGLAFLCDYSGALAMGLLGLYGWARRHDSVSWGKGFLDSLWYAAGMMIPVIVLWYYQWASFGNAILPPQQWMAPVPWIDVGYKGVGGLSPELLRMLLIDARFGLFVTSPIMLLALVAPFIPARVSFLPRREMFFCLLLTLVFVLFFGTVQYTRLQWVTGIRYIAPVLPFLFLPTAAVLMRLPRWLVWTLVTGSFVVSWSLAMVRSQGSVFENVEQIFLGGFQLPWLTVLSKTSAQYAPWLSRVSPLPLFILLGITLYLIWTVDHPWGRIPSTEEARERPK
ncbi:MAG: hypothetical protein ABJD11_06605 [Gemmatimonadota bacterium]